MLHPSRSAVERGVTKSSGIPARAGSSSDALARDRTTAPCLLPQASRVPAARCAGWLQAQAPGPSSTTTHRRRGRRAPPHASLRQAAPARRLRERRAAPAQTPGFVALTPASVRSAARSRPISTRNRARCDLSASFPSKCHADEPAPRHISGPRLAQRACEREQHRTPRERDHRASR